MVDRCVCCGEIIPEGRMVCPNCEERGNDMTKHDASEQAYKNGYSAGYEAGRRSVGEQKWIPVTEELPDFKTKVLVYGGDNLIWVKGVLKTMPSIYTGYARGYDEGWFTWDNFRVISNVTHWMPLPEPPNCGADMRGEEDG